MLILYHKFVVPNKIKLHTCEKAQAYIFDKKKKNVIYMVKWYMI